MPFQPLNDRILVQRIERDSMSKGGIIIPDTAKEKPAEALVVSTGLGKRDKSGNRIEMTVKSGDRVLFSKYSGTDIKLSGEDYLVLREDDVLAIIEH